MCRDVLAPILFAVILGVALGGCYEMHDRDGPSGTILDAAASRVDALVPMPIDGGACEGMVFPLRPGIACLRNGIPVVPVGRAYALPVTARGCFCEERMSCEVRVAGLTIELTTNVCDPGSDCFACVPELQTSCALPPLMAGIYLVRSNGADAFELKVAVPIPTESPIDACHDFAPVADSSLICPWPGVTFGASGATSFCHDQDNPAGERAAITLVDECASCFDSAGSCEVVVSGGTIRVLGRSRACDCPSCGVCDDVCERREIVCHTPPLEAGEYGVTVEGIPGVSRLFVADAIPGPGRTCAGGME